VCVAIRIHALSRNPGIRTFAFFIDLRTFSWGVEIRNTIDNEKLIKIVAFKMAIISKNTNSSTRSKKYYYRKESVVINIEDDKIEETCVIRNLVHLSSLLKFLPFQWNFNTGKMEVASRKTKTFVHLNLLWIFAYMGLKLYFLVYKQISVHLFDSSSTSAEKISISITSSLYFAMFGLALLLHFNNILNLDDIVCTINAYCERIRGQLGTIYDFMVILS